MNSQKRENLLNLSLDVSEAERASSPALAAGYDTETQVWELIVRYQGQLTFPRESRIRAVLLLFQYAILFVPAQEIEFVTSLPQITYIEKPKQLYFEGAAGRRASCIDAVLETPPGLSGNGILLACIDSGIDYTHSAFRHSDGSTRLVALWDQTIPGTPPEGYPFGSLYSQAQLNEALLLPPKEAYTVVPSRDTSGHGTAVLGIAAGGPASSPQRGVAPGASLLAVKLQDSAGNSFPRTSQLMMGVDFAVQTALFLQKPLVINLSFGNNYGSHSGTSLLETYLDQVCSLGRTVLCIGSGNEGNTSLHAAGTLASYETRRIEFTVGAYEASLSLQIWKSYVDTIQLSFIHPDGTVIGPLQPVLGTARFRVRNTMLLFYYGMPAPYSTAQEIFLELLPVPGQSAIDEGIWTVVLQAQTVTLGTYDLWLPGSSGSQTRFLTPSPETTLTIPSTARSAITVGAYQADRRIYAPFSGRGYTRIFREVKPELAAPGVNIAAPRAGGGYGSFTGTSFAVPFVSGSAALLMEWGIIYGNDPYLYGEKVKAFLEKGAKPLPAEQVYPNPKLGYGALCLKDSFPD